MGYSLTIGELEVEYDQDEGYCKICAKGFKHDNAPAFGEPTDFESCRWPSYSQWANFCRFVGLYELFFDECNGIIAQHPGCVPLLQRHKEEIDLAYFNFKTKYPNAKAGYSPKIDFGKKVYEDLDWPEENDWLCRLEWLKYWVDWALINCKRPMFENT